MDRIKVGIIGCGNISGIYLKNCSQIFRNIEVIACADILYDKAKARAEEYGVPIACTVDELINNPEVRIVINLTMPGAHAEICMKALNAGKNIYVEKPLAINREEGQRIVSLADSKGLLVGCAPDTFMGGGLQTCRKLIDDGWIGEPAAATAFMMGCGPEGWHPDPEFFYKKGGGPMYDMGPYYLTALVNLLGPVDNVVGSTSISFTERTITSEQKFGKKIKVEVPTHISGILNFKSRAVCTIITSFDVYGSRLPNMEIYGSEGTLCVPDPNTFGGPVLIRRKGSTQWSEIPLTHGYSENSRGIGVSDLACSLISGRRHRANSAVAYHVLDIMDGIHDSSQCGKIYKLSSTCMRSEPMPLGLSDGIFDC